MKQELLNLIDEKDKILALAHEENSFMNISFVVYDVPEFISWKDLLRASPCLSATLQSEHRNL